MQEANVLEFYLARHGTLLQISYVLTIVLKCNIEKSLRMLLLLLLSVILVMLLAINRQIALSMQYLIEKAAVDGLAEAEEVEVKVVEKVGVEAITPEKAGGSPKQVEVTLTILVFLFVVVLRATKSRIALTRKNLQKYWKSEKRATFSDIKTSGIGRLLLMKITESIL